MICDSLPGNVDTAGHCDHPCWCDSNRFGFCWSSRGQFFGWKTRQSFASWVTNQLRLCPSAHTASGAHSQALPVKHISASAASSASILGSGWLSILLNLEIIHAPYITVFYRNVLYVYLSLLSQNIFEYHWHNSYYKYTITYIFNRTPLIASGMWRKHQFCFYAQPGCCDSSGSLQCSKSFGSVSPGCPHDMQTVSNFDVLHNSPFFKKNCVITWFFILFSIVFIWFYLIFFKPFLSKQNPQVAADGHFVL